MISSIYTIPAGEEPVWAADVPHYGWVYATHPDHPLPPELTGDGEQRVIHCAPGTESPANVRQIIVIGHETSWTPEMIVAGWPNGHRYVMECTWDEAGEIQRGKIVQMPEGVEVLDTNLVPHMWAGDGDE